MKRTTMTVLMAALTLTLASLAYAKYVSGFRVVEVAGEEVTISKGNEKPVVVTVKKGTFQIGDKVEYDAGKSRMKKELEGC